MTKNKYPLILLLSFYSFFVNATELVTLNTRPGIEQKFILITPEKPLASVILFAGGKGALDLSSNASSSAPTIGWGKNNFLVRSRDLFAKHGFMVAVVDAPSDKQSRRGMLGGFRNSKEHVNDIDYVIRDLRARANVPVWLIGTRRGTESSTNIAIHSLQKPNGLVLTSSITVENDNGTPLTEMNLEKVTVPTLVATHTEDRCNKTPPAGAEEIAHMLTNAPQVEVKLFSGGDDLLSNPCKAKTYHGFWGIETKVVDHISNFIKSN